MTKPTHINLFGTVADSIVDGPGLRYAVFVQGCSHRCPGCHNSESQPVEGGKTVDIDSIVADIQANKLIQGVTLSGGEPFEQAEACAELAQRLKEKGYNLWVYTGYLYEDLLSIADFEGCATEQGREAPIERTIRAQAVAVLLNCADVLVDGPFVEERKSLGLKWRGSSNQRVIDMPATRKAKSVVKWEVKESFPTKPSSW